MASNWGVKGMDAQIAEVAKSLLATVSNSDLQDADRLAAANQAIEFAPNDEKIAETVLSAAAKASPGLQGNLLESLAKSKVKSISGSVVGMIKNLSPMNRKIALQYSLSTPDGAKAFLAAVEKGDLRFDMLALDQKTALASHPDSSVSTKAKELLAKGGGLPDANRQKVIEQLHSVITKTGDPIAGKAVFVQHCAKCHKHGDQGQTIGPDLTGFAVHPKEEILIHVLDPSRSVEGNYKQYRAVVNDGRTILGLLSSETKTAIELVDAEAKKHTLQRSDLDEFKETDKSLMPEGFEKQMKEEELVNLLEFMTQKGKYVPIPLDKYATVISTKGMFFEPDGVPERLVFKDWKPKEFKGVPFYLVDPNKDQIKNMIMLNGPNGNLPPTMPKSVTMPCNTNAKAIHMLSGIGGWNFPASEKGTTSMTVKLNYADGSSEKHDLKNGEHFADYIRRVDVPGSQFAFEMQGKQQVRYLTIQPKSSDKVIKTIELVKGNDVTSPVVAAITIETP